MKFIVIGLGNYGSVLAKELSSLGHEVIGADSSENRVDAIKDRIATAFVIDATDPLSLSVLPLDTVDVVIVAIGENYGVSIRVTAMLKQRRVKHIYARSVDSIHKAILEAFGVDKILAPEWYAARNLAMQLDLGTQIDVLHVDEEHSVMKFVVPDKFVGYLISDLNLDERFKLQIISLTHAGKVTNFLGASVTEHLVVENLTLRDEIKAGDELVCYGKYKDFQSFWKAL